MHTVNLAPTRRGRQPWRPILPLAWGLALACLVSPAGVRAAKAQTVAPSPRPAVQTVEINQLRYMPQVLVVRPGASVRWKNSDIVPHTVTTEAKGFDSGSIAVAGTWTLTAPETKGTYAYTCTFHPNMKGTLVVE